MDMSVPIYILLLCAVAAGRLVELRISRRNVRRLAARGIARVAEPLFPWMVLFHAAMLAGSGLEVVFLQRPFLPVLGSTMLGVFLSANALRWWVIRTLREGWSVRVVVSPDLRIVAHGPYRFVKHPNYVAAYVELVALPLIHTAWLTALAGAAVHLWVLWRRVQLEESLLLANPAYVRLMAEQPRFLPALRWPVSQKAGQQARRCI
jgi:methyltransferase